MLLKRNEVQIQGDLVIKSFFSPEKMAGEIFGLTMGNLIGGNCPELLGSRGGNLLIKKLSNKITAFEATQTNLISLNEINDFISLFCNQSLFAFRNFDVSILQNSFNVKIKNLIRNFMFNKLIIVENTSQEYFNNLIKGLNSLLEIKFENFCLVHRDIQLKNILVDTNDKSISLIDFEHSIIGPIELEFQNSIFWNDVYSVDSKFINSNIVGFNKKFEKMLSPFFICEQILEAINLNDVSKLKLIFLRTKDF